MEIRLLLTFAGLAISFALPTFAQEQNTVDSAVRHQIEAALIAYDEAWNKGDPAAFAARFTLEATDVLRWESPSVATSREAIEKRYETVLAAGFTNYRSKLIQIYPIGSDICAITQWSVGPWKGIGVRIFVHYAEDWKICMAYSDLLGSRR